MIKHPMNSTQRISVPSAKQLSDLHLRECGSTSAGIPLLWRKAATYFGSGLRSCKMAGRKDLERRQIQYGC